MTSIKTSITKVQSWLMQPIVMTKKVHQRLLFRALRSRFFLLVAALTALPLLIPALSYSTKLINPPSDVNRLLVWVVSVLSWLLFLLTVVSQWLELKCRLGANGPVGNLKCKK